jgi:hypothetical protein
LLAIDSNISRRKKVPGTQIHHVSTLRATIVPKSIAINPAILGLTRAPAPLFSGLVLPGLHVDPEWPLDVANTAAGTVAVF